MRARGGAILLVLIVLLSLVPAIRVSADTPRIEDVRWIPSHPIHPSSVTIRANISDPEGLMANQQYATWCSLRGACRPYTMTYTGGGVWETNVTTWPGTIGSFLEVYAMDTQFNLGDSANLTVLYVDSINVTLDAPLVAAQPGAVAWINGSAFYGPVNSPHDGMRNLTAPANGLTVDVSVNAQTVQATIDALGHFTASVTAPNVEGTWPITATTSDRNLTGVGDGTLAVSTAPRSDLTVANLRASPGSPVAGDAVTFSFDVKNVGTADATDVRVLVTVAGVTAPLLNETLSVAQGGTVHKSTTWTAVAGSMTFRVTVDPHDAVSELNETNNARELPVTVSIPPPPPGGVPYVWIAASGGIVLAVVAGVLFLRRGRAKAAAKPAADEGKAN